MEFTSSTVAIVGGGASGLLVAAQLLRQAALPSRILLYDPAEVLGAGVAYGTQDVAHLLNVPAGKMSALAGQPDHFLHWLNLPSNCASLVHGGKFTEADFVPRAIYARYLSSILEDAIAQGRSRSVRFEHRREKVVDFIPARHGGTLVTESADTQDVAHVVLALGNLPPRNPLPHPHPFFQSSRYIPYVWRRNVIERLSIDQDLLIIGSGLTSLDVVASLHRIGHRGRIFITSRNGRLPEMHRPAEPYPDFVAGHAPPATVRGWLRLVREELERARAARINWRPVLDALRPHTQRIWQSFSLAERRRFLRHLRGLWESHRHRAPQQTYSILQEWQASGKLTFIPGRIRDFVETSRRIQVLIKRKHGPDTVTVDVHRVLNCIGPESNFLHHLNDPLIVNLMSRGLLQPDPTFLGLAASPEGELLDLDGRPQPQLSTLGPPMRGVLWETTAMPEIRAQSDALAHRILAHLQLPSWQI